MSKPYGGGAIVDWDRAYCIKCDRKFRSRNSLYTHLIRSKIHNKKFIKEQEKLEKERKEKLKRLEKLKQLRMEYWRNIASTQ